MSLGKRKYIVDKSSFSGSIADFLRLTVGSYHKIGNEGNLAFGYAANKKTAYGTSNVRSVDSDGDGIFDSIGRESLFTVPVGSWAISKDEANSTSTEIKETFAMAEGYFESNIEQFTDNNSEINDWINIGAHDMEFYDHYAQYYTPFDSDEKILLNENEFTSNGNVEFVYNFFDSIREKKLDNLSIESLRKTKTSFDQYGDIDILNPNSTGENIILSPSVVESLGDISSIKDFVAMYSNISFDTDSISTFSEDIQETRYTTSFFINMLNYAFANNESYQFYKIDSIISEDGSVSSEFSSEELPTFNFQDFISDLSINGVVIPPSVKVYDINSDELGHTAVANMDVGSYFMRLILTSKINNLIQNNLRSYQDVLDGQTAYDETLLYEIIKFENGTFVERYFVANTEDTSINNIIDTHMRYDKEYQYRFYAHKLVIGSKHKLQPYADIARSWGLVGIDITTTPSVKIIRVPYFSFSGYMIDSPSISPDVNIVPYMGVDNKLLFLLNSPIGEYEKPPAILETSDLTDILKYQKYSSKLPTDDVLYKTDDTPYSFLVYRLDKKPSTIKDFVGNVRHQVSTLLSGKNYTFSASIVDTLTANTKYYYIFRSIDAHGKLSDLSEVYEAELVNDHGSIYLLTNIIDLEKESKIRQSSRQFRRLLQIKPNIVQTFFKDETLSEYSSASEISEAAVLLGKAEEAVWNKKFKVRLTSKKTGRIVDLNLTFNQQLIQRDLEISADDTDTEEQDQCEFSTPGLSVETGVWPIDGLD